MVKVVGSSRFTVVLAVMFIMLALLSGCKGDDGATIVGPAGQDAPTVAVAASDLTSEEMSDLVMNGQITSVTMSSNPVVNFWVKDQFGRGLTGLGAKATTSLDTMRFALAKLVPGSAGSPDNWVAYTGLTSATSRPSTENGGTMVDNGNGSYTYTFTTNVSATPANAWETVYEPSRTHRMVIQISGTILASGYAIVNPTDIIFDYVPAGGAVTSKREIVTTKACNDCHGRIGTTTPHGGRTDTRYCVVCHSDQRRIGQIVSTVSATGLITGPIASSGSQAGKVVTYVVGGEAQGNFPVMIHKIHMGEGLITGVPLALSGYNYAGVLFDKMAYPQDITNCRRCHQQSADAPQGDNWKNKPSRRACGSCHDNVDFTLAVDTAPYKAHTGGVRTDDFLCSGCHDAAAIETYHLTVNATTNNPSVPAGLVNFSYEISSVTVTNTTQPVIKFRIMADDPADALAPAAVTFPTSTTACGTLLAGFTGSPSFQMSFALAQDDIAASDVRDYNNIGKAAAQPSSVSITNICNGTQGVLGTPDSSGFYTSTITSAAGGFPSGSKMRAVGLQGYFTQTSPAAARHTISVVKAVTGDTARRSIVDNAKCSNCHEWFEGHGGNRVYDIAICTQCHVPNLSSSGRGADSALIDFVAANPVGTPLGAFSSGSTTLISQGLKDSITNLTAEFPTPANPLIYPEAAMNLKDLIHRTHASGIRETNNPFTFVRDRGLSGIYLYDFSTIVFPGIINLCETCHKPGTYDGTLPSGALPTIEFTGGLNLVSRAAVTAARASVPNAGDIVTSPFVTTCIGCHDSPLTAAHITQNGGVRLVTRDTYTTKLANETCVLCHSAGRVADPAVVHILPLSLPATIAP